MIDRPSSSDAVLDEAAIQHEMDELKKVINSCSSDEARSVSESTIRSAAIFNLKKKETIHSTE